MKKVASLATAIVVMTLALSSAPLPPNLARSAKATATSEFSGQYLAQFAVDGKIPEAGSQDDLSQAWCVRGDTQAILQTFDPVLAQLRERPRTDMAGAKPAEVDRSCLGSLY